MTNKRGTRLCTRYVVERRADVPRPASAAVELRARAEERDSRDSADPGALRLDAAVVAVDGLALERALRACLLPKREREYRTECKILTF